MEKKSYISFLSLYSKEVKRFLSVYNQTLIAPSLNALLYLLVFGIALGRHRNKIAGIDFEIFAGIGMMVMVMIQNGFTNTSSTLVFSKIMGNVVDYVTPPFQTIYFVSAFTLAAMTRAIISFFIVAMVVNCFSRLHVHAPLVLFFYIVLVSGVSALLGFIVGIFAKTFDEMFVYTNYIITPLSFLSGTFFSIKDMPVFWKIIVNLNPFFHMLNGIRYSFTGVAESNLLIVTCLLFLMISILFILSCFLIKKGWGIKD